MKLLTFLTFALFLFSCTPSEKKVKTQQINSSEYQDVKSELIITNVKLTKLQNEIENHNIEIRSLKSQLRNIQESIHQDNPESETIVTNQVGYKQKDCFGKMRTSILKCEPVNCLIPTTEYQSKKMFKKDQKTCSVITLYKDGQKDICNFPINESKTAKALIEGILTQDTDLIEQEKIDRFVKKYCVLAEFKE